MLTLLIILGIIALVLFIIKTIFIIKDTLRQEKNRKRREATTQEARRNRQFNHYK